jgi:hypothetical protein
MNVALLNGDAKHSVKEQALFTNSKEMCDDVYMREEGENRWEQVRSRNRTVFNSLVSSVMLFLTDCICNTGRS